MPASSTDGTAQSSWEERKREAGRVIATARALTGISQTDFAALVAKELGGDRSVTQSAVSFWESGRSAPQPPKLPAIEKVARLGTGVLTTILYGTDIEEEPTPLGGRPGLPAALSGKFNQLTPKQRRLIEQMVDELLDDGGG